MPQIFLRPAFLGPSTGARPRAQAGGQYGPAHQRPQGEAGLGALAGTVPGLAWARRREWEARRAGDS